MLTIDGTSLPLIADIQSVEFAKSQCTVDAASSATQIKCKLDIRHTCGNFKPALASKFGLIPIANTVTDIKIDCTMTAASPNTELNVLGGDIITFTGTNFPHQVANNDIKIAFANTAATKCTPTASNSVSLSCETQAFDKATDLSKTFTLTMEINGVAVTVSQNFQMKTINKIIQSMSPNSVSPVLRTQIVLKLASDFPHTLSSISDFTVQAKSKSFPADVKNVAIVAVDDATK